VSSPEDPPKDPLAESPDAPAADLPAIPTAQPATDAASVGELYPTAAPADTGAASLEPSASASGTVVVDDALLPATYDDNQLRDAVGAAPAKRRRQAKLDRDVDEEEPPGTTRSRRTMTIAALSIITGLLIATFVFLGRASSQRYAITCATDHISAERGRSFPPWGTSPLTGPAWKPIYVPPNAECKPRETENPAELEGWYLDLLIDRASTTLTTPNLIDAAPSGAAIAGRPGASPLDVVSDQLEQALLLSRSPDHRDQRKEVERLLGDVQYWRASLRLRDASAALADASRQFEQAATQRPRHVTDAAAWASFLNQLADELRAGPNGVPAAAAPPGPSGGDHPSAPPGTALPVEPAPTTPSANDTAPVPDAGVPTGGVLL
jgi:hypothetical protein